MKRFVSFVASVLALACLLVAPIAIGQTQSFQTATVLGLSAPWAMPGSAVDDNFQTGQCSENRQAVPCSNHYSISRASTGTAQDSGGNLISFGSNVLRRTDLGLLIEETRTNLALQSQTLDNAAWTKTAVTVSADAIAAPDGTLTADKLVETTATSLHEAFSASAITITSGVSYTWTLYAKAGERNWVAVSANDGSARYTFFDLTNGVVGTNAAGNTATMTPLANGWYRLTITRTSGSTSARISATLASADNVSSYTGDASKGAYFWGAQLELGAFPTTYIATTTVSVTRAADNVQAAGALLTALLGTSGSLRMSIGAQPVGSNGWWIIRQSGTAWLEAGSATTADIASNSHPVTATSPINLNTVGGVVASAWDASGKSCVANNGTVATDSNVFNPASPAFIFSQNGTANNETRFLKRLTAWNGRLPDSTLKAQTQ